MAALRSRDAPAYDVMRVRGDFPILGTRMNGRPLVYLDTAASAQKPRVVIETLKRFYEEDYANIHRGVYDLSQRATSAHDEARRKVQRFLNAADWREIVFTRNATEAINLVAASFARGRLEPGDEILVTEMEHHANIVPWQLVAAETGARIVPAPITDAGELILESFIERIGPRTKMIGVVWVSNVLGTVNPVHELVRIAHGRGVPILIDAAQAVQHIPVDVQALDADFLVFSGHKLYGPSGVGVLHAKAKHLEAMPPYQGGGDMIETVSFKGSTWNEIPFKFEAGTPDIAGIVALGAAIDYVEGLGLDAIAAHEAEMLAYATRAINQVPGVRVIGTAPEKCSVLTFAMDGVHPQDIATMLDLDGIAVRTGHHCAMPLHERFGLAASARASIGLYTTQEDIDAFVRSLHRVAEMFR
ncbi:aminotransferase class V-fold PLP-dependent enzyme [Benzoatithermus flavus]|uniref:Cysteine desulfurase n=1 Tax=Benzoatithermus flavus TaxID=3108223 RepID=A0ABU8XQM1_9PROT